MSVWNQMKACVSIYDYLAIGHVSRDLVSLELSQTGYDIAGAAIVSGRAASVLGCHTAILTSVGSDIDISTVAPECCVEIVPAPTTTSFSNIYHPTGRQQIVHSLANKISSKHVPPAWVDTPIVHLCPITYQVDAQLVHRFPHSFIGLTPQGWMRTWGNDGVVKQTPMIDADILLSRADAVVISIEDLPDQAYLAHLKRSAKLLIMTLSKNGCIIFCGDEEMHVPAPQATEINATGAGDIFATAFFVHLWRTAGSVTQSAEFANQVASSSVTKPNLNSKIEHIQTNFASVFCTDERH